MEVFWDEHYVFWQQAFATYGWELTQRCSFMAVAVPGTGPRPGWISSQAPWAEATAEAAVRFAADRATRARVAKQIRDLPDERIPCKGPTAS